MLLREDASFIELENVISNSSLDGIFFVGDLDKSFSKNIPHMKIPYVFIDFITDFANAPSVYIDNYRASYTLTRYLIENGHRAIAFVGDINSTDAIADRYYGYRKALNENRINFLGEWHVNYNLENNQGVLNFNFVEKKITAVVCHCDACAQKIYNELALKGQKIPDDISVVSFDDTSLCDNLIPKLTSIGAKKEVFAQKALNAMIELINTKNILTSKFGFLCPNENLLKNYKTIKIFYFAFY